MLWFLFFHLQRLQGAEIFDEIKNIFGKSDLSYMTVKS